VKFRASLDAHEASLADGRPLIPGEEYDLSPEDRSDPHNTRLVAENQLISISQSDKARADAADRMKVPPPPAPPITLGGNDNKEGGS
jgi:hypothetical protein